MVPLLEAFVFQCLNFYYSFSFYIGTLIFFLFIGIFILVGILISIFVLTIRIFYFCLVIT